MWQVEAVKPVYEWKVGMIEAIQDNPSLWFGSLTSKVIKIVTFTQGEIVEAEVKCVCVSGERWWIGTSWGNMTVQRCPWDAQTQTLRRELKFRCESKSDIHIWVSTFHILNTKEKFKMLRNYSSHCLTGPVFQKVGNCSKIWESSGEWDWGVRKETRSFLIMSVKNSLGEKSQHPCDLCVDIHTIFWILLWS